MGRLTYGMLVSLDGYVRDADGHFDWAAPDDELHAWLNEREQRVSTVIYGRGMWETMRYWEQPPISELTAPEHLAFAELWRGQHKVVVSGTLEPPSNPNTELWRELDPARLAALVRDSPADVSISGPTLAAAALRAGLVRELTAYVVPYLAGGLRFLPDGLAGALRLREQQAFPSGAVALVYELADVPIGPAADPAAELSR